MNKNWLNGFLMVGVAAATAFAQDSPFQFNGFVDTYHAVQTQHPHDFTTSRTRLRAELRVDYENAYLFTSLNGVHNSILEDRTGVQLQEAYFNYQNDFLEIRAGRQIVVWGVADGLRVTDLISPVDYTEFIAATLQRANYLRNDRLLEAFLNFDKDKSGQITKEELLQALKANKSQEKEIEKFIKAVDKNNDGKIDYNEFLLLMQNK